MTQKTKLEVIGSYTQDHTGPFCTRDGKAARVICRDRAGCQFPVIALVCEGEYESCVSYSAAGKRRNGWSSNHDLMNAREVPVAREFWISTNTNGLVIAYDSERLSELNRSNYSRTIHVREVLPGDGE